MKGKLNYNQSLNYQLAALESLREDMHRKIDFLIDQFKQNSKKVEILPNNNKVLWLKNFESLFIFYELLVKYQYIDCNWDFFRIHFSGNEIPFYKITFLKPINQLPYIMDCLQGDGYIAKCVHPHIRLAQHFFDRFGNPISNTVLRSSLNKGIGEKTKKFIEKNIINKLKSHIG